MKQTCQRIGLVLRHYLRSSIFLRDLLLTALTLSAMGGVCSNDLINFDDNKYAQHIAVQCGLDLLDMDWAWKTFEASNWHPLTWISLQMDAELFGPTAEAFHRTNLFFHLMNTLLLAEVLRQMSRRLWASAAVAALFAVHPLHVESVAWVSERKDVLSVFFGLLALLAYIRYARGPSWARLGLVCAAFAASLLAKPMLVTLPFLLLLLDYWPLQRLRKQHSAEINSNAPFCKTPLLHLLAEKLPLLLLVIGSCAMTVMAQKHGGAIKSLERFPFPDRIANALWSTACYLGQTFWPVDLGVYYPYPVEGIPWYCAWGAGLALFSVSLGVCLYAVKRPYLFVGWFWFLGTLIPVIGLVQVGSQARADRYTYFPLIGVFLMLVWGLSALMVDRPRKAIGGVLLVGALAACIWLTRIQTSYWKNSITLWKHTIAVTGNNPLALVKYGEALREEGHSQAALEPLRKAIRISPGMAPAYFQMGEANVMLSRWEEAGQCFSQAAKLSPNSKLYQSRLEYLRRVHHIPLVP